MGPCSFRVRPELEEFEPAPSGNSSSRVSFEAGLFETALLKLGLLEACIEGGGLELEEFESPRATPARVCPEHEFVEPVRLPSFFQHCRLTEQQMTSLKKLLERCPSQGITEWSIISKLVLERCPRGGVTRMELYQPMLWNGEMKPYSGLLVDSVTQIFFSAWENRAVPRSLAIFFPALNMSITKRSLIILAAFFPFYLLLFLF